MANKYDKEIQDDQLIRDALIIERTTSIYKDIRDKAQGISKSVVDKANKDKAYFNSGTKLTDFEAEFSEAVRPDYVRRDAFSKKVYVEEYKTAYFQAKFTVENQGRAKGFDFTLPSYQRKQFEEALNYPMSKLMNKSKMVTGRNLNINQLNDIIVTGVQQGHSLTRINKDMDIILGFRDDKGKWVKDPTLRKRQQYETQRTLRTEVLRMRSTAETDQWINQQEIVPSKLQLVETLDNKTRNQSVQMDGQIADKDGNFIYPNGVVAPAHRSGVAEYDINDRAVTINLDPEYPQETRIQRDPKTGVNEVKPHQDFKEYAKDNNLRRNIYGEYLEV
jgi:hypothetical protein